MPVFVLQILIMWDALFHCIAYDCSFADLWNHLRNVPLEDLFKLCASAAASEFCERVQVGIGVYTPRHKYQVKPHSSPWFSAELLVLLPQFIEITFFVCINRINPLNLK